jgi:ActR/RegA family two-component response regulator
MNPSERKRVLLAELDDKLALQTFRRLFDENRVYDVLFARTVEVTAALLQSDVFDVIVMQTHLANPAGLLRVRNALSVGSKTRLVAVTLDGPSAESDHMYALGADALFSTSASARVLADGVRKASHQPDVLAGTLDQMAVSDLLQILCLCRRSLVVRVCGADETGVLWLSEGAIIHAVTPALRGQDAVNRLVTVAHGDYSATELSQLPARTIQRDWQHVLLEAARVGDEAPRAPADSETSEEAASVRKASGMRKASGLNESSGLARYRELTELGLESVRSGNLGKAREYWKAARELGGPSGTESESESEPEPKTETTENKLNSGVA